MAIARQRIHLEALLGQEMEALNRIFEEEYTQARLAEKKAKDAARKKERYFVWSSMLSLFQVCWPGRELAGASAELGV